MIRAYEPIKIKYEKDSGEVSTRTIIPTITVPHNIRAVDISQFNEDEQNRLIDLFKQYQEYVDSVYETMFSFSDWVEHSTGVVFETELPWRTFKHSNTTVLD
jgi:hypothetical protein